MAHRSRWMFPGMLASTAACLALACDGAPGQPDADVTPDVGRPGTDADTWADADLAADADTPRFDAEDPLDADPTHDDADPVAVDADGPWPDADRWRDSDVSDEDSGGPTGPTDIPGGPRSVAPIVGCEQAERPARRDPAASEQCEAQAPGRCWFVSPEGAAANNGTFASPFGSPQDAVRRAGPGDIIYLRGGVYTDDNSHDVRPNEWNNPSRGTERGFISIGSIMLPEWAGGADYLVQSGTEQAPITVRSYPGERACATGAGNIIARATGQSQEVAYWRIEAITLHRGAVVFAGGTRGDDGTPTNQVHHIEVRFNEIFEYSRPGTNNPGLVKMDRGSWGGPYEILVESNILHDILPIDPDGVTRDWETTTDTQHFGAISMLSCERYVDPECVGNGSLTVRNNHIYHVPQAIFLKTPAQGPFHFHCNVIHDINRLGGWVPSNITFENNLVYRVRSGTGVGGHGGIFERNGHNLVFRDNTLIGFNNVLTFAQYASGHTVEGNVIQGLALTVGQGNWNNLGYIGQSISPEQPDTTADVSASQLARNNNFNDNCFVSTTSGFLAFSRRFDTGGGIQHTHLGIDDAVAQLGHEVDSDQVDDPEAVFQAFSEGDYQIDPTGPCARRGAHVPAWAP